MSESTIQREIRLRLGARSDVILWRNNTGLATNADGSRTRYGLCVGSSDLIGVLVPSGRFVALEIKAPGQKSTAEQRLFLALVAKSGGLAAVVHSADEAEAVIKAAHSAQKEAPKNTK